MADLARLRRQLHRAYDNGPARAYGAMMAFFATNGGYYPPQGGLGLTWFVDSNNGNDGWDGGTTDRAFATWQKAINSCVADRGDTIYLLPGHNENLNATNKIDLNKAGVATIGIGWGGRTPRFDFDHADAIVEIDDADCYLKNIRFMPGAATVTVGVEIKGVVNTIIEDCYFMDGEASGTDEFIEAIEIEAGSDNTIIRNCKFRVAAASDGAVSAIMFTGASDHVTIEGCDIAGQYSSACIFHDGAAITHVRISRNLLVPKDTEPGIELITASTGIIEYNRTATNLATLDAGIVADGVYLFENYHSELITESGGLVGDLSADD